MVSAICAWTVPDRKDPAVRDEWIKQQEADAPEME